MHDTHHFSHKSDELTIQKRQVQIKKLASTTNTQIESSDLSYDQASLFLAFEISEYFVKKQSKILILIISGSWARMKTGTFLDRISEFRCFIPKNENSDFLE